MRPEAIARARELLEGDLLYAILGGQYHEDEAEEAIQRLAAALEEWAVTHTFRVDHVRVESNEADDSLNLHIEGSLVHELPPRTAPSFQTCDDGPTSLVSEPFRIEPGKTYYFVLYAAARCVSGPYQGLIASWRLSGFVRNVDGVTSFLGTVACERSCSMMDREWTPSERDRVLQNMTLTAVADVEQRIVVPVFTGVRGDPPNTFQATADTTYTEIDQPCHPNEPQPEPER